MRFMIIIKSNADSEAGIMPDPSVLEAMGKYNDELIKAGVLLAAEGLHPSSKGARVRREGDRLVVRDGPFTETKELVAGFYLIDVKSRDEALEWVKRIPFDDGEEIELRKVGEASDFEGVLSGEDIAREQAWREANQKPISA